MMYKTTCIVLLFLLGGLIPIDAQTDLSSSGSGSIDNTSGKIDYTIGQVFCAYGDGSTHFTFGVQQPIQMRCAYTARSIAQSSDDYVWRGRRYSQSGVYTIRVDSVAANGCDSIYELRLSVLRSKPMPTIYAYEQYVVMVDHYPDGDGSERIDYNGYRWYHDGQLMQLSTNDYFCEYEYGDYTPLRGCFYVEVPADNPSFWVHSNEVCITSRKEQSEPIHVSVSPNPAPQGSPVSVTFSPSISDACVAIFSTTGRRIAEGIVDGYDITISTLPRGVYIIHITTKEGTTIMQKLVVH